MWPRCLVIRLRRSKGRRLEPFYDPADQPPPADQDLIHLLISRDGTATTIALRTGVTLNVFNIAWGYDLGDSHAHVTTNCSPNLEGQPLDFFLTSDIEIVTDPVSGDRLWTGEI